MLNLFFLYFSVLRAMIRSQSWQNQYVAACVGQFIIEVFLFETVNVLWVNWVIPRLACGDVGAVITSLRSIISTSLSHPQEWTEPLDTTNYFFVSTILARQYPHLLESIIVLSFHSYLPLGRMSNRWASKHILGATSGNISMFWRMFSLSALVLGTLQLIGTLDMELQAFIMSIVLPLALVAVVLVSNFMMEYPLAFAGVALILLYAIGKHFYKAYLVSNAVRDVEEETMISKPVRKNCVESSQSPSGPQRKMALTSKDGMGFRITRETEASRRVTEKRGAVRTIALVKLF